MKETQPPVRQFSGRPFAGLQAACPSKGFIFKISSASFRAATSVSWAAWARSQ
jgi:hypothetical protein